MVLLKFHPLENYHVLTMETSSIYPTKVKKSKKGQFDKLIRRSFSTSTKRLFKTLFLKWYRLYRVSYTSSKKINMNFLAWVYLISLVFF